MGQNRNLCIATMLAGLLLTWQFAARDVSAAELLMIDAKTCVVCIRFNKEAAPHYPDSPAAKVFPLRRIDINSGTIDIELESPVTMTPTFIFADKGVEMARFYGYPGRKHFFELVNGVAEEFQATKNEEARKQN